LVLGGGGVGRRDELSGIIKITIRELLVIRMKGEGAVIN
jgi:hypothetical protein